MLPISKGYTGSEFVPVATTPGKGGNSFRFHKFTAMSIKKDIGRRIRLLREEQNFTQQGMAAELGLTPGAYAKIERGETDLQITRLYAIAEILHLSIYSILDGDNKTGASDKKAGADTAELTRLSETVNTLSDLLNILTIKLETINTEIVGLKKTAKKGK